MSAPAQTQGQTPSSLLPATPTRLLLTVALVAAVLWLGWGVWRFNVALSCWNNEWPRLPGCEETLGRTPEEKVIKLQAWLAQNPGDAQARVSLAMLAQPPSAVPGLDGAQLLAHAVKAAPQHRDVLRMVANDALRRQDWPQAVAAFIRLARVHQDLEATQNLARLIAQSGENPDLMSALVVAMQPSDATWLDGALRAMGEAKVPLSSALPLISRALDIERLRPELGIYLISAFKREGLWTDAHTIWRRLWRQPLEGVFNGDFEQAFVPNAFDWEVSGANDQRSGARLARVGRSGQGQVLQVSLTGKPVQLPLLRQDLLLLPGHYRLSGSVQSAELRTEKGLAWVVTCARDGRELGRTEAIKATGRRWASWNAKINMPTDCGGLGAQLTLQTFAPSEAPVGLRGDVLFDAVRMERVSGEPFSTDALK